MAANDTTPGPDSPPRAAAWLRIIGVLVLLLGLGAAGLVYWMSAPVQDLSDDVATARTSKRMARQIEMNAGKMGVLVTNLMEDLQDPGTMAGTIAVASILLSVGCFYFARLHSRGEESGVPKV